MPGLSDGTFGASHLAGAHQLRPIRGKRKSPGTKPFHAGGRNIRGVVELVGSGVPALAVG